MARAAKAVALSRFRRRNQIAEWRLAQLSPDDQRERRDRYRALKALGATGEEAWRASETFSRYRALKHSLLFKNKPPA